MSASNGSSLSFLDLLTCALGGILLLFFVVITIREQHASAGSGTGRFIAASSDELVFVHVYSDDRSPIFVSDGPHLKLEPLGSSYVPVGPIATIDQGESFATFFSTSRIPQNSELVLQGLNEAAPVILFVADQFGAREETLPPGKKKVLYRFGVAK